MRYEDWELLFLFLACALAVYYVHTHSSLFESL